MRRKLLVLTIVALLASAKAVWGIGPLGGYDISRSGVPPLPQVTPLPEVSPEGGPDFSQKLQASGGILQQVTINANVVGRGAVAFDTTQLNGFALGTFLPSAIPVEGENFFNAGERASVQGSGSALQVIADGATSSGSSVRTQAVIVATAATPDALALQVSSATVQYENFIAGLSDTAFADPYILIQTIDLAGPNGIATILGPTGGNSQGRIGYVADFSGNVYRGYIGNISIENPQPEIRAPSGSLPANTFVRFAHVPDLVMTLKYSDGEITNEKAAPYNEFWHLQFGTVLRDIGIENGDKSIDTSAFGWGLQLSGAVQVFANPQCNTHDAIGFSVIGGRGIGHYINDLHALGQPGGNDAILNGSTLETLPAQAYYVGYQHAWNSEYQSNIGYSRVDLASEQGQVPTAYKLGDYVVVNIIRHIPTKLVNTANANIGNVFVGVEYLFGRKEELNDHTGQDQRVMFMLSFNK